MKLIANSLKKKIIFFLSIISLIGFFVFQNPQNFFLFIPVSTETNMEIASSLILFLEYFVIYDEAVILITNETTWALSFDNYNIYINFVKNLFSIQELEVLLKTFKEFEGLTNLATISDDIWLTFLPYENVKKNDEYYVDIFTPSIVKGDSPLNFLFKEVYIPSDEFFFQIPLLVYEQLLIIEAAELILRKKIFNFYIYNFIFMSLLTMSILFLNKSTNLIYTLLSFLVFAILSGLIIIFWGSEYVGLCVLLIYGAAIPVLALYIIMLVNVDLIQRLFFIESVKNFTFKKQSVYVFISISCAFLVFFLKDVDLTFNLSCKIFFLSEILKKFFFILIIKRYLNLIDTSYGVLTPSEIPLNFYNTDIDKVASAAFKLSYNELFALVLLLLIAIIVVISISRQSNFTTKIISYELYTVNKPLYYILWKQALWKEVVSFWLASILHSLAKQGEPWAVEIPFEYRFFRTLHLFYRVHDMGTEPYRKLMYLLMPRTKERKERKEK